MMRTKQSSKKARRSRAVPVLGAAGLSLTLAGAAATGPAAAHALTQPLPAGHEITLHDEEIADVSLATFHAFDREGAGKKPSRLRLAMGGGCGCGCGCGGCGGCWTGNNYTSSVFGGYVYAPPPPRPHRHKRTSER
jgi:hypothetical protein